MMDSIQRTANQYQIFSTAHLVTPSNNVIQRYRANIDARKSQDDEHLQHANFTFETTNEN